MADNFRPKVRQLLPVKCSLCGTIWDRNVDGLPPCGDQHSLQDWEDHYAAKAAAGAEDIDIRTRYLPVEGVEPVENRAAINKREGWD